MKGRRRQPQPFIFGIFVAICIGIVWYLYKANPSWLDQNITIILTSISIIILFFSALRLIFNKRQGLFGRTICIILIALSCFYLLWIYLIQQIIQWLSQNNMVMMVSLFILITILIIALLLLAWKKGWLIQISVPKNNPPSINQLINMGGYGFEKYIGELLKRDGWAIVQDKGGSGDWGKDLIVTKIDPNFGKHELYIQCKNWDRKVTPDIIRNLNGALPDNKAGVQGVVICPSGFTNQAEDEAKQYKILTWEYPDICDLWRKVTKNPVPAAPPGPTPPAGSWQEAEYKDFNQWVKDRFANIVVKGKTFAYRINRYTGRFERKIRRHKDDPWREVKYEDLSPWAMGQFANIIVRGKMFAYRIGRNTGKFEQKLK